MASGNWSDESSVASSVPRVMHMIPDEDANTSHLEIGQHESSVPSSVARIIHMVPDEDTSHLEIG